MMMMSMMMMILYVTIELYSVFMHALNSIFPYSFLLLYQTCIHCMVIKHCFMDKICISLFAYVHKYMSLFFFFNFILKVSN